MSLVQAIIDLTDQEGPNIPLRTLAIYCGVSHSTLSQYKNGKLRLSEDTEKQIRKGLQELAQEIYGMVKEIEV